MALRKFEKGDRGAGKFRLRDPASRKNSASIRRMLYDIIQHEFGGSQSKTRIGLTEALNRAEDQRWYRKRKFGRWSAYNVVRDIRTISFNELDSMGLFHGVPLALVVLFTQARSEVHSAHAHSPNRALRTLGAMRAALAELERILREKPAGAEAYDYLTYQKFIQVRDAYRNEFGDLQSDLPLPE